MGFLDSLDESHEDDFLSRVQKTQEGIGNLQQGETLGAGIGAAVGSFGGIDDDEDDFFKEFALEDLDAPGTQLSESQSQKHKGKTMKCLRKVPDMTEVSLEAQKREVEMQRAESEATEVIELTVDPKELEQPDAMIDSSIPVGHSTEEEVQGGDGVIEDSEKAMDTVEAAGDGPAATAKESINEATEKEDKSLPLQETAVVPPPNAPLLDSREKRSDHVEHHIEGVMMPQKLEGEKKEQPDLVAAPEEHLKQVEKAHSPVPSRPTQPSTSLHQPVPSSLLRQSLKSSEEDTLQLKKLRSKTPPSGNSVRLYRSTGSKKEDHDRTKRTFQPRSDAQPQKKLQSKAPLTLFKKRQASRSPTPKHTASTKTITRPHGERKAPRVEGIKTPLPDPKGSVQGTKRAFVPVRPTPQASPSAVKTTQLEMTAALQSLLSAKFAGTRIEAPVPQSPNPTADLPEISELQETKISPQEEPPEPDLTVPAPIMASIPDIQQPCMTEPETEDFSSVTRQLELVAMEARLMREHIMETRVRLAIQSNKLLRLDNPIVAERLAKLAAKARALL